MSYDLNKLARLQAVKDLADRIQPRLAELENGGTALKSVVVDGNSLKFYTTTDTTTATATYTIDLPAEMFLDSASTSFVPNFTFSSATYAGATDPNLDGKAVMVLGVKTKSNDGVTTTTTYSFIDVSYLVDTYTASDTSMVVSGYKLKANVSTETGNMLATTANGLYVDGSGKVDKVSGTVGNVVEFASSGAVSDAGIASADVLTKISSATENNFVAFDATGKIKDSGYSIATNTEVEEMLDEVFGNS